MRRMKSPTALVVYRVTIPRQAVCGNVVCEQAEWDEIERTRPGYHVLLYSGVKSEQEAEKLARGTAGDTYRMGSGRMSARSQGPVNIPPI